MVTNRQRYQEKVSQMISWGHWFALFNILLVLPLGSRYLFVSDWPATLLGRVYALVSWLGHFSFLTFAVYLLILFPLTFIVMSQRLMRVISAIVATAGLTLLIIDTEVFTRFRLHLNPTVWKLMINPDQREVSRNWQVLFISVPVIFLIQMLFGTWCWQKLRSLSRLNFAKPLVVLFIVSFFTSHLTFIWADANFYRPITMQKANLPLSYPMTARRFLEKHGLLDAEVYKTRRLQQGNPEAMAVEYPLGQISFSNKGSGYNLLMVIVDNLRYDSIQQDMPELKALAKTGQQFTNHYSTGNQNDSGLFGLFYGISPTYLDGILNERKPSVLMSSLSKQAYQFGLFSSTGFNSPLYRQALLADFSLPATRLQSNDDTTHQWQIWLNTVNSSNPWFAYVNYTNADISQPINSQNSAEFMQKYQQTTKAVDAQIAQLVQTLRDNGSLDKTVIVITANHGIEFNDSQKGYWGSGQSYSRYQLQVPLTIIWPGMAAGTFAKLTSHEDVMVTLMQYLLHSKSAYQDYSQGENLFWTERRHNWVTAGEGNELVITTASRTIVLKNNGHYYIYDRNYQRLKDEKPSLTLLLEVLTDIKRFIAN